MTIREIKLHLSLQTVLDYYKLDPNRNNLIACPFHDDDTPSLQLYPKTNSWHCFGCGRGTDAIDFIQQKENCTTHEALNKAKAFLAPLHHTSPAQKFTELLPSQGETLPAYNPITLTNKKMLTQEQRIETLTRAFVYFARSLYGKNENAKKYLNKRSLNENKLTIGHDSHNFHKANNLTVEQKEHYLTVGLIYPDKHNRQNHYHSFFDGCIVFPTYNEKGEMVNLYGRCIDESKQSKHRYLPGKHQGIYPSYPKAETEKLILTESIIDAATLMQHEELLMNNTSVMALYGTNNFTVEHQQAIRNLQALKEVILFYDGDKAGREAIEKHARILKEIKPNTKVSYVDTPDNEDINSLLQGHEASILAALINERKVISPLNENFSFTGKKQEEETVEIKSPALSEAEGKEKKNEAIESIVKSIVADPIKEEAKFLQSSNLSILQSTNSTLQPSNLLTLNYDNPDQLIFETSILKITLWGGIEIQNVKRLRATLHIQSKRNEYLEYRDTIDLYSHNHTQKLIREASERLEKGTTEISKTITSLTQSLEAYRQKEREKQRKKEEEARKRNEEIFTVEEMQRGEKFLKQENLMQKTEEHIKNIGLVGEEEKGLLLFFILLTRMFKDPLHALVQGKSGSGKTYLLKKIASLLPKSHIRMTTALTENTLYHSAIEYWKHKVLLIEDLDGAFGALLPLREMMSNQSISKLSTEKDLKSGEFAQKLLYTEGPLCVAGATTKDKIYEDNANRSFLIQVNETREHQQSVLEYQRKEIAGLLDKSKQQETQSIFKTAQLHLEPLEVIIPFGNELRIPDYVFKKLRTNAHYLTLIKAIAFWHQKQRKIKQKSDGTNYIEATLEDVGWANKLSKEVLLRKSDELSGALREFFESIKNHLRREKANSFFASRIRHQYRMHPQQMRRNLEELKQRGYIKQIGNSQKTGYEYEILQWDDYQILQNGITIMDEVLKKLKQEENKKGESRKEESKKAELVNN